MAQLDQLSPAFSPWSSRQTRAQFRAIAWLRWRIFVNRFRRKGGTGELIGLIITYPLAACLALLPIGGAGFGGWYFAAYGPMEHISWALWGMFALCQFLNIQLGQPGTTFDPTQLIRFPLTASQYVAVRLFFGLLTPSNILVMLMSLAMAIGITVARPSLWFFAFVALAVFAVTNVILTRMIFAWVDRWLSTRRAREIFTAFIFIFSMGIQYVNLTFNHSFSNIKHRHRHNHPDSAASVEEEDAKEEAENARIEARFQRGQHFLRVIHPALAVLPPELTASGVVASRDGRPMEFAGNTLGCACFAALFFTIFSLRTRTEYRGENFSDMANGVAGPAKRVGGKTLIAAHPTSPQLSSAAAALPKPRRGFLGLSPTVTLLMGREFLTLRRNTGLIYGLVAPIFLVFIMAARMGLRGSSSMYIFPGALAYSLMGISPMAYNSFGLEGAGVQFYFISPTRMRDVFLAKNLMNIGLGAIEVVAIFAIISKISGMPPLQITIAAVLWAVATLLTSMTLGNRRSITTPKKIDLGRTASKQTSPTSALISIGVLLAFAGFGAGMMIVGSLFNLMWILPPVMGIVAAVAVVIYRRDLERMDAFTYAHRDQLFEELCKK